MKVIRLRFLVVLVILLLGMSTYAAITLPAIVSSHMVLQRNTEVVLWGWAEANEEVTISLSWLDEDVLVKADKEGNWKLSVTTTNSKEAQTIQLKSEASNILLEDILFGEVWLCSGQSNMEMPIKGYKGQPAFNYPEVLLGCENLNLRLFTVYKNAAKEPLVDVANYNAWQSSDPEAVADFSAIAYYFGEQLQQVLNVPVGLIHTSWGGSSVQAWMSKETLSSFQEVNLDAVDMKKSTNHIPTALYNAMIAPLIPYGVQGMLWYQGESNRGEPLMYEALLPAMVADWSERLGKEELPFYFVQIAPYVYNKKEAFSTFDNTAFMRESMERCLDLIPHSGMAVTLDIGDDYCIHPPKKKEVATRLLYSALSQTYGMKVFDGKSPRYSSMEVKDEAIIVHFDNAENGLFAYGDLKNFEIAGEDKVFYPAVATIFRRGDNVVVHSDAVTQPVAVRYAWRNFVVGTLFDTAFLPASSFRTDDWDEATRVSEK